MSLGSIIGGVVGGVIGFWIGGPYGAFVGASFGLGIGAMVDPLTPDVPSPGQPDMSNLSYPSCEEGVPIPDILGCTKLTGNITWVGANRAVPIYTTQTTEGGKGGGGSQSQTTQTGWNYYNYWSVGLCMGPVDKLYTVYNGDNVVWNGELTLSGSNGITGETITLAQGMGSMTFYFGTADQELNATIQSQLADPTLHCAHRNQCYAVFNDNYTGSNSNRIPAMKFVLGKFPDMSWTDKEVISVYDYNPSACAYYTLNTMLGIDTDYLNSDSFSSAATTLWKENLGLSINYDRPTQALTYLTSMLSHVQGMIKYSTDGKFHYKCLRKDAELYGMTETDEDVYLDKPILNRVSWIDTLNSLKVAYSLRLFKTECVIDAPSLSLIGQTSWADCEGEADYAISLGCPPFTLQRTIGGLWEDVGIVSANFTWLYTPEKCVTTDIRVIDILGRYTNTITLEKSCVCTGTTLHTDINSLSCSEVANITISGSNPCCDYAIKVTAGNGESEWVL